MNIDSVIESLLFVSGDGLAISHIAEILELDEDNYKGKPRLLVGNSFKDECFS